MNLSRQKNANTLLVGESGPISKSDSEEAGQKSGGNPFMDYLSEKKRERKLNKMIARANKRGDAEIKEIKNLVSELHTTISALLAYSRKRRLMISSLVVPDKEGLDRLEQLLDAILTPGQHIMLIESLSRKNKRQAQ